jgi:hypothetical protein
MAVFIKTAEVIEARWIYGVDRIVSDVGVQVKTLGIRKARRVHPQRIDLHKSALRRVIETVHCVV